MKRQENSTMFRSTGKGFGLALQPSLNMNNSHSLLTASKHSPYEAKPYSLSSSNSTHRKLSPLKSSRANYSDISSKTPVQYKPSLYFSDTIPTQIYSTSSITSRKPSSDMNRNVQYERAKTPTASFLRSSTSSTSNFYSSLSSSYSSTNAPDSEKALYKTTTQQESTTRPQLSQLSNLSRVTSLFPSSTADKPVTKSDATRPLVGYTNPLASTTSRRIYSSEYLTLTDKISMSPRPINSSTSIAPLEKSSSLGVIPKPISNIEQSRFYLESAPKASSNTEISLVGLQNLGNTCYMNSVLQCLSNITELRDYFLQEEYCRDVSSTKGLLAEEFGGVVKKLWGKSGLIASKNASFSPYEFKKAVEKYCGRFTGYSQEDAQEFLRYLLDSLHECLNRVKIKPPFVELKDIEKEEDFQKSERWFRNFCERNDSKIVDLFCGQLKSTLECSKCRNKSTCFDPFMDLNIPVPKNGSISSIAVGATVPLDQCFDLFFQKEDLVGDDAPYCSQCKANCRATKHLSLFRVPKILVLHLKRFSNNGLTKINTEVEFPIFQNLDTSSWIDKQSKVQKCKYELISVVNHNGTLYGGHYFATARSPLVNNQWINYNDSEVTVTSSAHVANYRAAYLLFYQLVE